MNFCHLSPYILLTFITLCLHENTHFVGCRKEVPSQEMNVGELSQDEDFLNEGIGNAIIKVPFPKTPSYLLSPFHYTRRKPQQQTRADVDCPTPHSNELPLLLGLILKTSNNLDGEH